jgi:ATP-binding cassette subfamily D (ALD) long-chain fatty acid import protein
VLVKDLSFKIEEGEHLMITGSNGVGKTSVARVLAGLWPVPEGGEVRRPADDGGRMGVFVVPQRVYMVEGTLLDQMIYPHTYVDFRESGRTEAQLMEILAAAHLAYLPAREGGWSARKEWRDVLSGGEKQRVGYRCLWEPSFFFPDVPHFQMGMARVFYHRPRFVILDGAFVQQRTCLCRTSYECLECTSAVSSDVEGSMYEHAKSLGITLITVSLR